MEADTRHPLGHQHEPVRPRPTPHAADGADLERGAAHRQPGVDRRALVVGGERGELGARGEHFPRLAVDVPDPERLPARESVRPSERFGDGSAPGGVGEDDVGHCGAIDGGGGDGEGTLSVRWILL